MLLRDWRRLFEPNLAKRSFALKACTWCRCSILHKWQNSHWHLWVSGSFPYFQIKHTTLGCTPQWTMAEIETTRLPTKELVQPTLCVQALAPTALGVSLWKSTASQSTQKPQGNESFASRAMQDWAIPDPDLPLHSSASTSLRTCTIRSCKHYMVSCGSEHTNRAGCK